MCNFTTALHVTFQAINWLVSVLPDTLNTANFHVKSVIHKYSKTMYYVSERVKCSRKSQFVNEERIQSNK